MKLTLTMIPHSANQPKNSTRWDFEKVEGPTEPSLPGDAGRSLDLSKFKPSFYVPRPFAEHAKRLRITIEEVA